MKKLTMMILMLTCCLGACRTSNKMPLTYTMTPEQVANADPLVLCLDQEKYVVPNVDEAIKQRNINCKSVLTVAYTRIVESQSNYQLCDGNYNSTDALARSVGDREIKKRGIDCSSVLIAKAQNDMNRPRYTTCNMYGCTTY